MLERIWNNFITSGMPPAEDDLERQERLARIKFLNVFSLAAMVLSAALCATSLFLRRADGLPASPLAGAGGLPSVPAASFLLYALVIVLLRRIRSATAGGLLVLLLQGGTSAFGIIRGGAAGYAFLHAATFPMTALYLYGIRRGSWLVLLFGAGQAALGGLVSFGLLPGTLSTAQLLAVLLILLFLWILAWLQERRQQRMADLARRLLFIDPLTGLANRTMLMRDLARTRSPILFLINLDDFKEINATFGYRAGDAVLVFLARKLEQYLPAFALRVYKLASDEYAILADGSQRPVRREEIESSARHLAEFINGERCMHEGGEIALRVSMGIAGSQEIAGDSILSGADIALKTAKKVNRPYLFYSDALQTRRLFESNIRWFNILSDALDNDRIVPYYQPIVNNRNGRIENYECLIRLIDREGQLITPEHFLDIAKRSRLYPRLTRTVIRKAIEAFRGNDYPFSINLAAQDFLNPDFLKYIRHIVMETPAIRGRIGFEILESEGIENYDLLADFIREMRSLGCRIVLDDFGAGYSNFDQILRLKLDCVKIDGSLIRNIPEDPNSRLIVENVVSVCRKMGIPTVAEFVHSEQVFQAVRDLGVDYSQGYYFGRPEPATRELESREGGPGGTPPPDGANTSFSAGSGPPGTRRSWHPATGAAGRTPPETTKTPPASP
jgi:diguanylate cyclase (GGDEF)-like protein